MNIYRPYHSASFSSFSGVATVQTTIIEEIVANLQSIAPSNAQLCQDSRALQVGDIFVAFSGDVHDGRSYLTAAIEAKAAIVLAEADGLAAFLTPAITQAVVVIAVNNLKQALGLIASGYYGKPSQRLQTIGVTGTNGKTTVVNWIAQLLEALQGKPCAVLGTLGVGLYGQATSTGLTTPQAAQVHAVLAQAVAAQAGSAAIEATSIGLEEGRLNGVAFQVAAFTNLTQDHLDYHGTMAAYADAKRALFDVESLQAAVLNIDDALGEQWAKELAKKRPQVRYLTTGLSPSADVQACDVHTLADGTQALTVRYQGQIETTSLPALGLFNVHNALTAIGCVLSLGYGFSDILRLVPSLQGVAGRMQLVSKPSCPLVVVDYAHTPDGLAKALHALQPVAQARGGVLTVVFGCGGNRDTGKRPLMGAIAQQYAQNIMITNDNPRDEAPALIAAQIACAAPKALIELDRALAIQHVILQAMPSDVVLIAGKGHETTQTINKIATPFSDIEHAQLACLLRSKA